jgi:flavin-dependent dehydrogenase
MFFPRFVIRSYAAIQEWFNAENAMPLYACVFDPSLTDSYAWALVKNGRFLVGGAFPHKHALAAFNELKRKLSSYQDFPVTKPRTRIEACTVFRPLPFQFCGGKNGVFLIGEAAGFISPSSLEGISYALKSARNLADVFLNRTDFAPSLPAIHRSYRRKSFFIAVKLIIKNLKAPFMYRPFLRFLVMKSGISSVKTR